MSDDEEEEDIAIGKADFWHLYVHVHGKEIHVSCGDASQRMKWVAHVGIGKLVERVLNSQLNEF